MLIPRDLICLNNERGIALPPIPTLGIHFPTHFLRQRAYPLESSGGTGTTYFTPFILGVRPNAATNFPV